MKTALFLSAIVVASGISAFAQTQREPDFSKETAQHSVENARKDQSFTVKVGAMEREFLLHVPPNAPANSALVILFHGGAGRADTTVSITRMNTVADRHGFCVAYPQGLGLVWNDGGSDLTDNKTPRDDVAFVRELIAKAASEASIDRSKIYACGFSNGGSFASRIALETKDLIRGAAMVGSGLYKRQVETFKNPAPLPILFIEGTDDPCHPYDGGMTRGPKKLGVNSIFQGETHGEVLSLKDAAAFWCKVNQCAAEPVSGTFPHIQKDALYTTFDRWAGANGNDVVAMTVHGGGHCWPGGIQYFPVPVIGKTTYDFSASEAIWRFFANHGAESK